MPGILATWVEIRRICGSRPVLGIKVNKNPSKQTKKTRHGGACL
jgi:hypothetical protein